MPTLPTPPFQKTTIPTGLPERPMPTTERVVMAHRIWESVQDENVGNDPTASPLHWADIGPTNRFLAFDLSSTTKTQIGAADYYEFTPGRAVNAVGLVGMDGVLSVRVRLTDPNFGLVYDKTISLRGIPQNAGWHAWFFEPRTQQNQLYISDLPSYPNAKLRVDMTSSGTAYVGALIFGNLRTIGTAVLQGASVGIQDYSKKTRNDYGDTYLKQGAFAQTISVEVIIDNDNLDNAYFALADLRATPSLLIASDKYRCLSSFGFYQNFSVMIPYANHSICRLDWEGLT